MSRPSWMTVAVGTAAGFLVGVLLVVALGGPRDGGTRTVTKIAHSLTTGVDIVVQVRVPPVTQLELSDAQSRLEKAGFQVDVSGRSTLDELFGDPTYTVTAQNPRPGVFLRRGGTVHLDVTD